MNLVISDDTIGIDDNLKIRIFERGFGKNTNPGHFLTRKILEITGISITENGKAGYEARFELVIPAQNVTIQ